MVGKASHAEYDKNEILNAEVRTRLVGFDETSKADTRFDTWKWVNNKAVGGLIFA